MTSPALSYEQQLKARYAGVMAKTRAAPTTALKPATVPILPKREEKRADPPVWQTGDTWFDAHVFIWADSRTPRGYLRLWCSQMGVSINQMKSRTRLRAIVHKRQLLMWEIKTIFGLSYPAIGLIFGGRDHTTALHACRKVEEKKAIERAAGI